MPSLPRNSSRIASSRETDTLRRSSPQSGIPVAAIDRTSGARSAATHTARPVVNSMRTARPVWSNSSKYPAHESPSRPEIPSSSVRKPEVSRASCSSSAFSISGQASSRTRSIAAVSSAPRSSAEEGSKARRVYTAWVRRSSAGASSRKAYGLAFRIS